MKLSPAPPAVGGGETGRGCGPDVRLDAVEKVDREPHFPLPARRQRVEADPVRLRERQGAPRDLGLVRGAARVPHRPLLDAVLDGQEEGRPGGDHEIRALETHGLEPPEAVRQDQRERDPQREIGLEEVEADEHGLPLRLLQQEDEGAAHGLEQRLPCRQRPHAERLLDRHLRQVDEPHHGVVPGPVEHDGLLHRAEGLDRDVAGGRVDEDEAAGADLRGRRAVEHDHVEGAHASGVLAGSLRLEDHLRVGAERLLQEQVAGAHEEDAELPRLRHHRVDDVVRVEIVPDVGDGLDDRPGLEGEGDDDVPLHLGIQRDRLLADLLVVDRQREREGDALVGEVGDGQECLVVERPVVGLPDGELRDPDVPGAAPDRDPPDPGVGELPDLCRVERAVGQHVHAHPRVDRGHEGQRRADRLAQVVRLVTRVEVEDGPPRPVAVAGEVEPNRRLRARLDDHQLGALARLGDQAGRLLLGLAEAARPDVPRLHGGRGVHHEDQPLGPLPLERQGRAGRAPRTGAGAPGAGAAARDRAAAAGRAPTPAGPGTRATTGGPRTRGAAGAGP